MVREKYVIIPVTLDSRFFHCESVLWTVLSDELIVSATMNWEDVFSTLTLISWWLVLPFCFFSGVSPTAVRPVTSHSCGLADTDTQSYTRQAGYLQWASLSQDWCVCVSVCVGTFPVALCSLRMLWCFEMWQLTQSHLLPGSVSEKHLGFWVSPSVLTLKPRQDRNNSKTTAQK